MWEEVGQYGTDLDRIGSQDRMYFKLTCKNKLYIIILCILFTSLTKKKHLSLFGMHAQLHTHAHTHTPFH